MKGGQMSNTSILDINSIRKMSPVLLANLLKDRTTQNNIIWGTDDYSELGDEYIASSEIKEHQVTGENISIIQPRVMKEQTQKRGRTREKAEVFTPSWVCNAQNNLIDEQWFGRNDIFNSSEGSLWNTNTKPIEFPQKGAKTWQRYVDAKRLEISCGEAPYIVSRYDSVSGKPIPIQERIGLLDRKLRVVNENTESKEEWIKWAQRAVESIYGYEFQGDSLLLARENILYSYIDYYKQRFAEAPNLKNLHVISHVISWNIWQMDGLNYAVPYCEVNVGPWQMTIFDYMADSDAAYYDYSALKDTKGQALCKIRDWRSKETLLYKTLVERGQK